MQAPPVAAAAAAAGNRRRSRSSTSHSCMLMSIPSISSCRCTKVGILLLFPLALLLLLVAFVAISNNNSCEHSIFFVAGLSSTTRVAAASNHYCHHHHCHDRSPLPPPIKGCQHPCNRSGKTDNCYYWRLHANTPDSVTGDDTIRTNMMTTTTSTKKQRGHHPQQTTATTKTTTTTRQHSSKYKGRGGGATSSGSNYNHTINNYYAKTNNAAWNFNSRLTGCNTVSELLSAFMEQTSSSSSGEEDDNNNKSSITTTIVAADDTRRSSATHLAGANKVNSVNFSTCLHRLARFATADTKNYSNNGHAAIQRSNTNPTNNSHESGGDNQRRKALSDPRFAILVCSMAEMACGCDANLSIGEGDAILENWKKSIYHGSLRDGSRSSRTEMEKADDVLNAIAIGHANTSIEQQQKMIKQSRQSLTKAAMDQLTGSPTPKHLSHRQRTTGSFSSRECSNVCWALAKLRMAPPGSALPVGRVMVSANGPESIAAQDESTSSIRTNNVKLFVSIEEMALDVLDSSLQVRMKLYEEACSRKQKRDGSSIAESSASSGGGGSWIPELSRLAGKVLDLIAAQIINEYGLRLRGGRDEIRHDADQGDSPAAVRTSTTAANSQEMASLLYAFAKAGRGDDTLFSIVAQELMRQTSKAELEREGKRGPKPQGTIIMCGCLIFES